MARATSPSVSIAIVVVPGIGSPVVGSVAGPIRTNRSAARNDNAPPATRKGARLGPGMWIPGGVGAVGRGREMRGPAVA